MIRALWKPWYVYRPNQLVRRLAGLARHPRSEYAPQTAAWGLTLLANPTEHIGRSLRTTGIYDLAVSEMLFRLVRSRDLVIDAGANIGYMTLLTAVATGPNGRVIAFEPNPELFSILERNIAASRARIGMAPVDPRQTALGTAPGLATLVLPDPAAGNNGLAYIPRVAHIEPGRRTVEVIVETVDAVLHAQSVGVMKIDVEGHERLLLEGASLALRQGRIRDIVFEDHQGAGSESAAFLQAAGYKVFAFGWSMRGLVLAESQPGVRLASAYEAPSYLATREPDEAIRACRRPGWRSLRRQTRPRLAA
jgi:FkbM family methyltransferase